MGRRSGRRWGRERVAQANMSECVPVYICIKAITAILVVPPCPKRKGVWECEPVSAIYSICFCIFRFVSVCVCGWISLTNFYVKNCKMFLVFGQWARNHNTNVGIHIFNGRVRKRGRERWVIRKMVIGGKWVCCGSEFFVIVGDDLLETRNLLKVENMVSS